MLRSTILFLVLLRLAIGWHFFFEGAKKVDSTLKGKTDTEKPFTSEGYFRNGEGPLAPVIVGQIGDTDEIALAKLTVKPLDGKDPGQVPANQRIPDALAKEWDAYFDRFVKHFGIEGKALDLAQAKLTQSKDKVVEWLTTGTKKVEVKFRDNEIEVEKTTADRIAEYKQKRDELRHMLDVRNPAFERDVLKKEIPPAKAAVASQREELLADLGKQTDDMKKALTEALRVQLPELMPKWDPSIKDDDAIVTLVSLQTERKDPNTEEGFPEQVPSLLSKRWDDYVAGFKQTFKLNEVQMSDADQKVKMAKIRYARWLQDIDPLTGTPNEKVTIAPKVKRYRELVPIVNKGQQPPEPGGVAIDFPALEKEVVALRGEFQKHIDSEGKALNAELDSLLTPAQTQPTALEEPKNSKLEWMDWSTRWGLTLIGVCLLIGLFTRLACIGGAMFLFSTCLIVPALPWLPTPPNSEGFYFIVNKNVIEMFALLVLATVPSGRWVGLDGLLTRIIFGSGEPKEPAPVKTKTKK